MVTDVELIVIAAHVAIKKRRMAHYEAIKAWAMWKLRKAGVLRAQKAPRTVWKVTHVFDVFQLQEGDGPESWEAQFGDRLLTLGHAATAFAAHGARNDDTK